ncbi:MAG TPA: hotdog fold thioesterase [Acidimicrobiia bacterium]
MSGFNKERVEGLFAVDAYAEALGVELVSVTDDELTVALEVEDRHLNFLGGGHGGMVFSLADCAFSLASNSAGPRAVAIDTHMVFTAAARAGDKLTGVATELSRGRTLATYHVTVTRQDRRVAGIFTGTVHISAEN